jgi:hypothetical protein
MSINPRAIAANPPFGEDGNSQRAAKFAARLIEKSLRWLGKDSQFTFISPQSFLTNTTYGIPNARNLLTENCQTSKIWQFSDKATGIDAEQAVCIILEQVGKPEIIIPRAVKAVFPRARDTVSDIRNHGFLATQWITRLQSDSWEFFTSPPISIQIPTIPLGNLLFVFNGVTPSKNYNPVSQCPPNTECQLNWGMKWQDTNRLWADPERVREEEPWIRYGKEFLHTAVLNNSRLFRYTKESL